MGVIWLNETRGRTSPESVVDASQRLQAVRVPHPDSQSYGRSTHPRGLGRAWR